MSYDFTYKNYVLNFSYLLINFPILIIYIIILQRILNHYEKIFNIVYI